MIRRINDKLISEAFAKFEVADRIYEGEEFVKDKYCVSFDVKRRYVNPLVQINDGVKRIYEVSEKAKKYIDDYWAIKTKKYAYFNFNF